MQVEKIKNILYELNKSVDEIEDSAVVLSDGFVVASNIVHNIDEEKLGTISAALFGIANKAATQFEKEEAEEILIKCNLSYLTMIRIDDESALFIDFKALGDIGNILKEANTCCKNLREFI